MYNLGHKDEVRLSRKEFETLVAFVKRTNAEMIHIEGVECGMCQSINVFAVKFGDHGWERTREKEDITDWDSV